MSTILIACKTNPKQAVADIEPDKRLLSHTQKIIYTVDSLEWLKKEQLDKISSKDLNPQIDMKPFPFCKSSHRGNWFTIR